MARLFQFIIILCLVLDSSLTKAQQPSFEWANGLVISDGVYTGLPTKEFIDDSGNTYITGYFKGTYDFDPGQDTFMMTSTAKLNVYIIKLNGAGNFLWARSIGGDEQVVGNYETGVPIVVDLNGNVYITGFFRGTTDFDPGPDTYQVTSTGARSDIFILKLDGNGTFQWVKSMGSGVAGIFSIVQGSMALDDSGSIYITGGFSDTIDFDPGSDSFLLSAKGFTDVFILKMDFEGNFIWAKTIGGVNCQNFGYSITLTNSHEVVVSGYFTETTDFNPGSGTSNLTATPGTYNSFLLKLDSSGNFLWVKRLGGEKSIFGYSLNIHSSDEIYMAGTYQNTIDFDPGPGIYNLSGGYLYVLKLTTDGQFEWARSLTGNISMHPSSGLITIDPSGNLYLAGYFIGPIDFDPGPDTLLLSSNGYTPGAMTNFKDIFLLSLNAEGDFRWVSTLGGPRDDEGTCIATNNMNIYFTGNYNRMVDFDPGPEEHHLALHNPPVNFNDVFIVKWSQMTLSDSVDFTDHHALIYPNPVSNVFYIRLPENPGGIKVQIYSRASQLIQQNHFQSSDLISIPFEAPAGIYFVYLTGDNGWHTVYKVVKN